MSFLVKGMEMPKEGSWSVVRIYQNGICVVRNIQGDYTFFYNVQFVPVPQHGRLIDADATRADIDEKRPGRSYEDAWTLTVIDAAPTVIEAEEGGEMPGMTKYPPESWRKTNADRLRAMTDEGLAEWAATITLGAFGDEKDWLNWLKQEATDESPAEEGE